MMIMTVPMIKLDSISHTYKNGICALDGVSISVDRGEVVGILGPNGAGKSTLVKALTGLIRPTSGTIRIKGLDVLADVQRVRRLIGFVPQETALYDDLTAQETLEYHAALYGVPKIEVKERVQAMLELAGLVDRAHDLVKTYSGGMKRRLALVRAMLHDSEVVILDEMSLGVDVQSRNLIWEQVKRLKDDGRTIVFCTNYMDEAEALADRLFVLDHGHIVAEGPPADLKRKHIGDYMIRITVRPHLMSQAVTALSASGRVVVQMRDVPESEVSEIVVRIASGPPDLPAIVEILRMANVPIYELAMREPSLGDVFLKITGAELRD